MYAFHIVSLSTVFQTCADGEALEQIEAQVGVCHHLRTVESQHVTAVTLAVFKFVVLWRIGESQVQLCNRAEFVVNLRAGFHTLAVPVHQSGAGIPSASDMFQIVFENAIAHQCLHGESAEWANLETSLGIEWHEGVAVAAVRVEIAVEGCHTAERVETLATLGIHIERNAWGELVGKVHIRRETECGAVAKREIHIHTKSGKHILSEIGVEWRECHHSGIVVHLIRNCECRVGDFVVRVFERIEFHVHADA